MEISGFYKEVIQKLNKNQVEFLLVGGLAVGFHGYARFTGAIDKDVAMATAPPGHDSYIEPITKSVEHYMRFHQSEKVTDLTMISELEKDNPPEKDATIDRPLSENEVKDLEKSN